MTKTNLTKTIRSFAIAVAFALPLFASAGNIPQYKVSRGTAKYAEFKDGTEIPCSWKIGEYGIYPGGKEYANPCADQGFPIGFDFRFAGTIVNQFVVSSLGEMYVGHDEVKWGKETMKIAMFPNKTALNSGSFSYKTTGAEGSRVFQLQFNEAVVDEGGSYIGSYSLQYRLYEADGTVEFAFSELNTGYQTYYGFHTGLWGLTGGDAILLTAKGLNPSLPLNISAATTVSPINSNSYIAWDRDDYDKYYQDVFVFEMPKDTPAPASAPQNLTLTENGSTLNITCKKADDADATVILWSNSPFTPADYPTDGESFSPSGKTFGNATAIYYANGANPAATIKNIDPAKEYYIEAISANGYPNYNTTSTASARFLPSQAPPASFKAEAKGTAGISLSWQSEYPVIIAATTDKLPGYEVGYKGLFGTPSPDAKAGDEIEGGGKVVYAGDAAGIDLAVDPNSLNFFRAWNVRDGKLSATSTDCFGIPQVSMPYEPDIESYPTYMEIPGWTAVSAISYLIPWYPLKREFYGENTVVATSSQSKKNTLTSPLLPTGPAPVKVSFEYALETVRPASADGVPTGNEPGYFGDNGYLKVSAGGEVWKTITSYEGTMVTAPDGYESMSSTFIPVEVEIPAFDSEWSFSFEFRAEKQTYIYLRNIKAEYIAEVSKAPLLAPANAVAEEDKEAILHFSCERAADAEYTLVLFSESPISSADYPEDGVIPAVGSSKDGVTVLYFGKDEKVTCQTDYDIVMPDFGVTYYFVALSASGNPLYNRENVASVEYTTMKEVGKPTLHEPVFDEDNSTVHVSGLRHADASSTLVLLSQSRFDGELEDGRVYETGETVGNATVLYHGSDDTISHLADLTSETSLIKPNKSYVLTAVSANERGWFSDSPATRTFTTPEVWTGINDLFADPESAIIYNIVGQRVNPASMVPGLYILNGRKVIINR